MKILFLPDVQNLHKFYEKFAEVHSSIAEIVKYYGNIVKILLKYGFNRHTKPKC